MFSHNVEMNSKGILLSIYLLLFCNEGPKLPLKFAGCEATVTYIRTIDGAFDILNSRNPLGKGTKAAMKLANKEQSMKIVQDCYLI